MIDLKLETGMWGLYLKSTNQRAKFNIGRVHFMGRSRFILIYHSSDVSYKITSDIWHKNYKPTDFWQLDTFSKKSTTILESLAQLINEYCFEVNDLDWITVKKI